MSRKIRPSSNQIRRLVLSLPIGKEEDETAAN